MNLFFIFILTLIQPIITKTTGQQFSLDSTKKYPVNFYGRLTTHQGHQYKIENMSLKGNYKQIEMFDKPNKHPNATLNQKTNQNEIHLELDPITDFPISKIDLNEIQEVYAIPTPIWIYEQKNRKKEYIEIVIISKNRTKTKQHHLTERNTKLNCDEINEAGPIEKIVPVSAIKELIIDGFSYRNNVITAINTSSPAKKE